MAHFKALFVLGACQLCVKMIIKIRHPDAVDLCVSGWFAATADFLINLWLPPTGCRKNIKGLSEKSHKLFWIGGFICGNKLHRA